MQANINPEAINMFIIFFNFKTCLYFSLLLKTNTGLKSNTIAVNFNCYTSNDIKL